MFIHLVHAAFSLDLVYSEYKTNLTINKWSVSSILTMTDGKCRLDEQRRYDTNKGKALRLKNIDIKRFNDDERGLIMASRRQTVINYRAIDGEEFHSCVVKKE
jgi:hypothetical protein